MDIVRTIPEGHLIPVSGIMDYIISIPGIDRIISGFTKDLIIATHGFDIIIPRPGKNDVIKFRADNGVVTTVGKYKNGN